MPSSNLSAFLSGRVNWVLVGNLDRSLIVHDNFTAANNICLIKIKITRGSLVLVNNFNPKIETTPLVLVRDQLFVNSEFLSKILAWRR